MVSGTAGDGPSAPALTLSAFATARPSPPSPAQTAPPPSPWTCKASLPYAGAEQLPSDLRRIQS